MKKDDQTPFSTVEQAAKAVVAEFISENVAGPSEALVWRDLLPSVEEALRRDLALPDGRLPNMYEVSALNGGVPEDGSDDESGDFGVPVEVMLRFPHTDGVIAAQF